MAFKHNVCIASIVLLFACLQEGSALQCYECNSHNDTRCALEVVPEDLLKTCPDKNPDDKPYILCRKIKQMIDFEVNGLLPDSRVIRSCGWDDSTYKNRCYHRSGFGGRQEVCACEGDKCNGSTSLAASMAVLGAALAALKLAL